MSRLDDLPPDLRAALALIVDRGKSYAQVAELLAISEAEVHERAHEALDELAGGAPPDAASDTAGARAGGEPKSALAPAPSQRANASDAAPAPRGAGGPPVSRRAGAVLLAGLLAVIILVAVLVATSGSSSSHGETQSASAAATTGSTAAAGTTTDSTAAGGTTTGSTASTPTTTQSSGASGKSTSGSAKGPTITKQLTLTPPEAGSKSIGIVEVLKEGSERAFYIAAEHLPPSQGFYYAIWLASPTKSEAISKSPSVGSTGRLQGGALLPSNAGEYDRILLTRETSEHPTKPGPAALSGTFSLGS